LIEFVDVLFSFPFFPSSLTLYINNNNIRTYVLYNCGVKAKSYEAKRQHNNKTINSHASLSIREEENIQKDESLTLDGQK
jgi:hypothetical protein